MCSCRPDRPADPSRRQFFATATLIAASGLLASACSAFGPSGGFSGSFTFKASDYPALASVGGVALLSGSPIPMAAVRTSATTFEVLSRVCPHQGATIGLSGTTFVCPGHGAEFNVQGANIGGFPAGNMQSFNTSYDTASGVVTVTA